MYRKACLPATPRQFNLAFDVAAVRSMTPEDRARAVSVLAQLLVEASGSPDQTRGATGDGDEDR